jgi:hypothetical protein
MTHQSTMPNVVALLILLVVSLALPTSSVAGDALTELQLIETRDDFHTWIDTYTESLTARRDQLRREEQNGPVRNLIASIDTTLGVLAAAPKPRPRSR